MDKYFNRGTPIVACIAGAMLTLQSVPVFADSVQELRAEAQTYQVPRTGAMRLQSADGDALTSADSVALDIDAQRTHLKTKSESVQGVDLNRDGVRDDIERRIIAQYPGQENDEKRAYAFMAAKRYQTIIATLLNPRVVYDNLSDISYINDCFERHTGASARSLEKAILPMAINTLGRVRRFAQATAKIEKEKIESKRCD